MVGDLYNVKDAATARVICRSKLVLETSKLVSSEIFTSTKIILSIFYNPYAYKVK